MVNVRVLETKDVGRKTLSCCRLGYGETKPEVGKDYYFNYIEKNCSQYIICYDQKISHVSTVTHIGNNIYWITDENGKCYCIEDLGNKKSNDGSRVFMGWTCDKIQEGRRLVYTKIQNGLYPKHKRIPVVDKAEKIASNMYQVISGKNTYYIGV